MSDTDHVSGRSFMATVVAGKSESEAEAPTAHAVGIYTSALLDHRLTPVVAHFSPPVTLFGAFVLVSAVVVVYSSIRAGHRPVCASHRWQQRRAAPGFPTPAVQKLPEGCAAV
jgi:hypothetical protein